MTILVFNTIGLQKRAAVIEDGKAVRLLFSKPAGEARIGDIYMGRVLRVLDGIQAAFVDIGTGRHGYLQKEDLPYGKDKERLSQILRPGDGVAVQVKREAQDRKGPKLTGKLSLQGNGLVFYNDERNRLAVSRKIENKSEADRLLGLGERLHDGPWGLIFRTHARDLSECDLEEEYGRMRRVWEALERRKFYAKAPSLLLKENGFVVETVVNSAYAGLEKVVFDCLEDLEAVRAACPGLDPDSLELADLSAGEDTFALWGADKALASALQPRVALEGGGDLVIEETEALTAIDVNLAGGSARKGPGKAVRLTNGAAVFEAARQIVLRNLSGLILIDFLDTDEAGRDSLCREMERLLSEKDNRRFDVNGFTRGGLMEISRERKGASLEKRLLSRKAFPGPVAILGDVESALRRIRAQTEMRVLELSIDPETAEWLDSWAFEKTMETRYGLRVKLKPDRRKRAGEFETDYLFPG